LFYFLTKKNVMGGIKKNEVLRLVDQMDKDVRRVYVAEITPLSRMRAVVLLVRDGLAQLSQVMENGFADSSGEIYFFKTVWPSVMGWQFYAADRFAIELARPVDVVEKVLGYLKAELDLAQQLFSRYPLQYAYFRQGMDELDGRYFVRSGKGGDMLLGVGFDVGDGLGPSCSNLWARFMAAERLRDYLLEELMRLELGKGEMAGSPDQGKLAVMAGGMRWTGEKVNLIELAHSLFVSGQIENGKVGITEFFERMGRCFEIDLGIPKRGFDDLSTRKRLSRTHFLELLREGLNSKFDDADAFDPGKGRF
jgi:hypothetical protein